MASDWQDCRKRDGHGGRWKVLKGLVAVMRQRSAKPAFEVV
jgi:hypothetical protein